MAFVLVKQIVVMFFFMAIGYGLYRNKKLSAVGCKEWSTLLLYVITPCIILKAYLIKSTPEKIVGLALSFFLSFLALLLSVLVSRAAFGQKYKVEHFGTAFSNAGFIGIPLIQAALGQEAVFYVSAFVALLNLMQWTYGIAVMTERRDSIQIKNICKNPILISILVGLVLFFTNLPIPTLITSPIGTLAAMNAPVAMMILGSYLAQVKWRELFAFRAGYWSCALRLVVIPLLTLLVLWPFPEKYETMKLAVLIAASAPVGTNVVIFAQRSGLDTKPAVQIICLSTLLSLVTIPIWAATALWLW